MQTPLILASSSPYRAEQLRERLGLQISALAPDIDECAHMNETANAQALRLSEAKAQAVAARTESTSLIIAGDQTAQCEGISLRKPEDRLGAIASLHATQGKTVTFFSGVCLLDSGSGQAQLASTSTEVTFRPLSLQQIEAYVDRETPWGCLGAFKNEGLGIALLEKVTSSDPSALTGLPLIALSRMLNNIGVDVLRAGSKYQDAGPDKPTQ